MKLLFKIFKILCVNKEERKIFHNYILWWIFPYWQFAFGVKKFFTLPINYPLKRRVNILTTYLYGPFKELKYSYKHYKFCKKNNGKIVNDIYYLTEMSDIGHLITHYTEL